MVSKIRFIAKPCHEVNLTAETREAIMASEECWWVKKLQIINKLVLAITIKILNCRSVVISKKKHHFINTLSIIFRTSSKIVTLTAHKEFLEFKHA